MFVLLTLKSTSRDRAGEQILVGMAHLIDAVPQSGGGTLIHLSMPDGFVSHLVQESPREIQRQAGMRGA